MIKQVVPSWNQGQVDVFEETLASLVLEAMPQATGFNSLSLKDGDRKISFRDSEHPCSCRKYFLAFSPKRNAIISWVSGIGYDIPFSLIDHLSKRFPEADYELRVGHSRYLDGSHYWRGISENELFR